MIPKDVFAIINSNYSKLTKAEKKVADFIFEAKPEVQYMTITTLAVKAKVADATIFRFCRSLGFTGYNDFKLSLAKSMISSGVGNDVYSVYGKVTPEDSISDIFKKQYNAQVQALSQTLKFLVESDISLAVDMLCNAEKVYCLGQGGSLVLAMETWTTFLSSSDKFYCVQDNHQQAMAVSMLKPNDCIIFFSYSGNTRDLMDVLPDAHKAGVKVILITGFPESDASKYADVILNSVSREGPLQMGSIATKTSQLFLVDILYNEFCRRDMDKAIKNRETTSRAIAKKLL